MAKSIVDYNLTGIWPENESHLDPANPLLDISVSPENDRYIKNATIEQGALQIIFRAPLDDKSLTLRPATPESDPQGPVIWIAGHETFNEGWVLAGKDRTTVPAEIINYYLK
jgi:hypothetical protein